MPRVGVIYSLAQLVRRELIITDNIDPHVARMRRGEGWLEIPLDVYQSFNDANAVDDYIATLLGEPTSDKCAIVYGDGTVVGSVCADPVIDSHDDGFLIQDDMAKAGGVYDFENAISKDINVPAEIKPRVWTDKELAELSA